MSSSSPFKQPKDCPYEITGEEIVFQGKWMNARQVHFIDPKTGTAQVWQSAVRNTKPPEAPVHGVHIIAHLLKDDKKYLVLVKQYRIPLMAWCLEFPAGLVDPNESIETAGLRELEEETGYLASRVLGCSRGRQALGPGLTDDTVRFVHVEIDGAKPSNANPIQKLGVGEQLEVVVVEMDKLLSYIEEIHEKDEMLVDAMIYTYAMGMQWAK